MIVFPWDITALQLALNTAANQTDLAVSTCAGLDPAVRQAWEMQLNAIRAYCKFEPGWLSSSGSFYDQGVQYQKIVYQWQVFIEDGGCHLVAPKNDPTPPDPAGVTALKWGAVIAVSIAGVYGVSKLVQYGGPLVSAVEKKLLPEKGAKT